MLIIKIFKRSFIGLFLFSAQIFSDYNLNIVSIDVEGNSKTFNYIIEREIKHNISMPLDSAMVRQDCDRIENLGIFSQVTWKIIPLDQNNARLVYIVIESVQNIPPTILPAYDEKTGWSIVGSLLKTNWRGRNQTLSFNISAGGKDTYGFIFYDPWRFGNHVSMRFQIDKSIYDHNFLDYNIETNVFRIDFGRWFGEKIKSLIGFSMESKSFEDNIYKIKNKYNYFSIKPVVKYDTRNIYWNPLKGIYWLNDYELNKHILNDSLTNFSWKQSISVYKKLNSSEKDLIFAINGTCKFLWGIKEKFWLNYMGDSYTVRGWKLPNHNLFKSKSQDYRYGYQLVYGSLELRKVLIPKFVTEYETEFGLLGVFFIDLGVISDNFIDLNKKSKMIGSGFGIRIPFPLIQLIRVDYGWGYVNKRWNSGSLHWGISHKF